MKRSLLLFVAYFFLNTTAVVADGHGQAVGYRVGDKNFSAFAMPANSPPKGNVYIIHDWNGLDAYEKKRVKMLSDLGYNAVALDLFGVNTQLNGFDDYRRETSALYKDRQEFRKRIAAGISAGTKFLNNGERTILMGYCFGGAAVLEAARAGIDMDGFVSFHGGLKTPEGQNYAKTSGEVLILHGSADPVSGMGDLASLLQQLQEVGVAHNAQVFGGARHSFTVEGSRDFNVTADRKSWEALLRFLN